MSTTGDLDTIRREFTLHYKEYAAQRERIEQSLEKKRAEVRAEEEKIARLELAKISWINHLVKPLMEKVIEQLPGWQLDDMSYASQDAYVSIFCFLDPKLPLEELIADSNSIYIRFLPGDLHKGELLFDCSDLLTDQHPGERFVPLESIGQAVDYLRRQAHILKAQ